MNKQEAIKELESHKMIVNDARSACYNEAIKAGIFVINQLDEPQKQVVPGFVAELLDYYRQSPDVDLLALLITFKDWYYSTAKDGDHEEAIDWLVKHPEIYMRAWLFGYEVEKEPLYYVKIPSLAYDMFLVKGEDGELIVFQNTSCGTKFTEAEIKAIDERYWAFAVPVEEG
ncbi:DUF1642 domain-containing protein [Enterococcus hirae]|uniref:DUF1642 domain-containing protein n=1 Tax=Enterococcus hirae TaxID=1354 RepID=UPI001A96E140|nr:DUF1642 domain-containing protein [Enterococcus hirae]MBO1116570.1 DUF1642 domain-containing protein [Enterococcus hirae]